MSNLCACGHTLDQHDVPDNAPCGRCQVAGCDCLYPRKPLPLAYSLRYLFWGMVSNAALDMYYFAPREMLQDEFFQLHRFAVKRAHTVRLEGEQRWSSQ